LKQNFQKKIIILSSKALIVNFKLITLLLLDLVGFKQLEEPTE